jgi:flavin reductase (DIM6/NTAB) family NADH-FMN oxidoreductase RutF
VSDDIDLTGAPGVDAARFRQVMGHFCTGITIVTAVDGDEPVGFTAQSFTSVSLDPPLVLLCPGKTSSSWPRIKASGSFCVNILADDQEALCRGFATAGVDKFKGVGWTPAAGTGSPVLGDVLAWADCHLVAEHDAGDHTIAVGRVVELGVRDHVGPLLFFRGGYGSFQA